MEWIWIAPTMLHERKEWRKDTKEGRIPRKEGRTTRKDKRE